VLPPEDVTPGPDGPLPQLRDEPGAEDSSLLERIRAAVATGDGERARALASRMLEEDALALLEDLEPVELSRLFAILGDESLADLLARLDDRDAAAILSRMSAAQAADILEEADPDDAADILEEVADEIARDILVAMEPAEAEELRELLAYPPDTAGGLMTPAFVAVAPNLRADETVVALRQVAEEAETVNYVYVVDADDRLLGVLSLHNLVFSRPETPVGELMIREVVSVPVDADQEVAARIVTERDLLALPVVDADGRLLGIITADDVADVLEAEVTEDIALLGGSQPLDEPYLRASPLLLFRKRIVWLLVLFFGQFITISVLDHYETELDEAVVLATFIPILIGTGGNVGSQTVTTLIRAMAVDDVRPRHLARVLRKEMATALALGAVMGGLMFVRGLLARDGNVELALTVGLTVPVIVLWAATVAAVLPLVLSKLRVDPAVVSAPLITSLVDGTGLVIYLTLARIFFL
jgi:magnesium transporter